MTQQEPTIVYAEEGAVAHIRLNRPQALNSLTEAMLAELRAAFTRAEENSAIRALVITGTGRGFCAGADLAEFDLAPGPNRAERANPEGIITRAFNPAMRHLLRLRVPTVCAVNGVAAGAGASLALACDITLAAPGASFIQAFSRIGLIPDCGSTWMLPARVGMARALALAMTGDKLSAADAKAMGLIWDVAEEVLSAAQALALRLADMPTRALVATRELMRAAPTRTLDAQLDAECLMQARLGFTHDYLEGVAAFLEKRPAQFTGA